MTLVTAIWATDIAGLIFGKFFGRHKLAPSIRYTFSSDLSFSPQKTIEGFVGSMLVGSTAFYFVSLAMDWKIFGRLSLFAVSILFIFLCVVGDLYESWIKRICKAKDSGTIFPGHGGMMDRTDSFIFSVPFIFIYINCF